METAAFLDTQGVYRLTLTMRAPDEPHALFRFSPPVGVAPLRVEFSNASRNAEAFRWDFGDGEGSEARDPVHIYAAPGAYAVQLTVCRGDACDVATGSIVVEADDGGPLEPGTVVENRIDYVDDTDRYTFSAPAGAEVSIALTATDADLDTLLILLDPAGDVLLSDDDGGDGTNSRLANVILPRPGEYTIDAGAFPGTGPGEYTLTFDLDPEPLIRAAIRVDTLPRVIGDEAEFVDVSLGGPTRWTWRVNGTLAGTDRVLAHGFPDAGTFVVEMEACNVRSCDVWSVRIGVVDDPDGGVIAANESVFGTIQPVGDRDEWLYEGAIGEIVTVRVVGVSEALDTVLELRAPNGTLLASDDDGGGALNPLVTAVQLPEDGTYTIVVFSFPGSPVGGYRLDLIVAPTGAGAAEE